MAKRMPTRAALTGMVLRLVDAGRIPGLGVAAGAPRSSTWQWGVRSASTPALRAGLATVLVGVGFAGAAAYPHPTGHPTVQGIGIRYPATRGTASESPSGSRPTAQPHPRTTVAPVPSDEHSDHARGPEPDIALEIRDLPPARDDPALEDALTELDKKADRDQLASQHQGLSQSPPSPTPESAVGLPDRQASDAEKSR